MRADSHDRTRFTLSALPLLTPSESSESTAGSRANLTDGRRLQLRCGRAIDCEGVAATSQPTPPFSATPPRLFFGPATTLLLLCAALGPELAAGHAAYQNQIPNGDKVFRNGVHWPGVGHVAAAGGGNAENTFGTAFAAAGHTWTTGLCNADTDGDGFSNGWELGDPGCVWSAGQTPERTAEISHPGYSDSAPLITTPSFRLNGPTATEGVLQARIHPRAWGAVNFPFTSTAWAREYCRVAGALDEGRVARAWSMAQRPSADQQHLPAEWYVSISDVTACAEVDMATCLYAYSDVGSPQNTTKAETHAIYVDCAYNVQTAGHRPDFHPLRLLGPDPGRGTLQAKLKTTTFGDPSVWSKVAFGGDASGVCEWLLSEHVASASYPKSSTKPSASVGLSFSPFDPPTTFANVTATYGGSALETQWECQPRPASSYTASPALLEAVVALSPGHTQASFAALVAATYPGVAAGDVVFRLWKENATAEYTHAAFHVSTTVAAPANPNAVTSAITGADAATFGVLASRADYVDDASAPGPMPSITIDGPAPHRGVVKGRYGADPWGLVAWPTSTGAAKAFCAAAGQTAVGWSPRLTLISAEGASADPYVPADRYVSMSDATECGSDEDVTSCKWHYSPPGSPRNISDASLAVWVDCQASQFPEFRIASGPWPCHGFLQARLPGSEEWKNAASDLTMADTCALAGCPCYESNSQCSAAYWKQRRLSFHVRLCNIAGDRADCTVDEFDPPYLNATLNAHGWTRCHLPTYAAAGAPAAGRRDRVAYFGVNGTVAQSEVLDWMAERFNVTLADLTVLSHTANATIDAQWFALGITNEHAREYNSHNKWWLWLKEAPFAQVHPGHTEAHLTWRPVIVDSVAQVAPAGPPEFKLDGPSPTEGFLLMRYPGESWGKVASIWVYYELGPMQTQYAEVYCRTVGQYDPDHRAHVFSQQVTPDNDFMTRTNYSDYWSPIDLVSVINVRCNGAASTLNDCGWGYNNNPNHPGAASMVVYVDCRAEVPQYRLAGAFPGMGKFEYKTSNFGWWRTRLTNLVSVCQQYIGLPAYPGHTPTAWFDTTFGKQNVYHGPLPCGPGASPHTCRMNPQRMYINPFVVQCVPPLSVDPFGGAAVTQFNAAFDHTANGLTMLQAREMVAEIAGVVPEEVLMLQWMPRLTDEITHVTIQINNTGVNANLALNSVAGNSTFGWIDTDVRQMPVPATVPTTAWEWALEPIAGRGPMEGFVTTRPTNHYLPGVPCAARWSTELSKTFCATIFGVGVLAWPRPPAWRAAGLGPTSIRNTYVEDIVCAPGATDITACSYAYAEIRSVDCAGDANILIDCQPPTRSETISPTSASASRSASAATPTLSRSATATRRTPTRSHVVSVTVPPTGSRTVSRPATPSRPLTRSLSLPLTATKAVTPSLDLPTPGPPSPVPATPAPPPPTPTISRTVRTTASKTFVPPTPPPPPSAWVGIEVRQVAPLPGDVDGVSVGGRSFDARGLRPGAVVEVTVNAALLRASAAPESTTASLEVRITAGEELAFAACGESLSFDLPAECTLQRPADAASPYDDAADAIVCSIPVAQRPASSPGSLTTRWQGLVRFVRGDLALANNSAPSAATTVLVTAHPNRWDAATFVEANGTAEPRAEAAASVPLLVSSATRVTVTSADPAMNAIAFGTTMELRGSGLDLLPVIVFIGPWAAHVIDVAPDGGWARVEMPSVVDATETIVLLNESTVRAGEGSSAPAAVLLAEAHESEVAASIGNADGIGPRRATVCTLLGGDDASPRADAAAAAALAAGAEARGELDRSGGARIRVGRGEPRVLLGDPLAAEAALVRVLRRIHFDWGSALSVELRPPAAANPAPDSPVPEPALVQAQTTDGPHPPALRIPVFVTGCDEVSNSTVANMSIVSNSARRSSRAIRSSRLVVTTAVDSAAPCAGHWATFEFDASTADALAVELPLNVVTSAEEGSVTVAQVPANVTVRVDVWDPLHLTRTSSVRVVRRPGLAVTLRSANAAARYAVDAVVHATDTTLPPVSAVRVLVYPDTSRSLRTFPVRVLGSSTTAAAECAFDASNVSTACARAAVGGYAGDDHERPHRNDRRNATHASPWELGLRAPDAPAYFTGRLVARLHVGSAQTPWFALSVELPSSNITRSVDGSPSPAAPVPPRIAVQAPPGTNTTGTAPELPPSPEVVTPAADGPSAAPIPAPEESPTPAFGAAVSRGVFGFSASCDGTAVNFLAATLAAYAVLAAGRLAATAVLRRRRHVVEGAAGVSIADADSTPVVPRSILHGFACDHVFVSAVVPCHHYCGAVHATALLVHVLVLYAVAAALVNAYPGMADSERGLALMCAVVAAAAAVAQPVVALPFRLYTVIDARVLPMPPGLPYVPADLQHVGVKRRGAVGVSDSTLAALADVAFDANLEGCGEMTPADAFDGFDDAIFATALDDAYGPAPSAGDAPSVVDDQLTLASDPGTSVTPVCTHSGATTTTPTEATLPLQDATQPGQSSSLPSDLPAGEPSLSERAAALAGHDAQRCVAVDSAQFTAAGYVFAGLLSCALVLAVSAATAGWCRPQASAFRDVVAFAAIGDATVAQVCIFVLRCAWQWLNADREEDSDSDSEESLGESSTQNRSVSSELRLELHPVHEQRRFVGSL